MDPEPGRGRRGRLAALRPPLRLSHRQRQGGPRRMRGRSFPLTTRWRAATAWGSAWSRSSRPSPRSR
eukprot:28624-Alexandrium_andersonii.AAC.1